MKGDFIVKNGLVFFFWGGGNEVDSLQKMVHALIGAMVLYSFKVSKEQAIEEACNYCTQQCTVTVVYLYL